MKQAKSLSELAAEVGRQSAEKHDYLVPTERLSMSNENQIYVPNVSERLNVNDHCNRQIATYTGIGTRYYRKMQEECPDLLATNVNHWFQAEENAGKTRMIRELDNTARAMLSDHYLRLDNDIVMTTALTALAFNKQAMVKSCEVNDRNMYLKVVFPHTETAVKVNDPVQAGVLIQNSEVGSGCFKLSFLVFRLVCTNGMVMPSVHSAFKRNHIGKRVTADNIEYSQSTMELMAKATLAECEDALRTYSNPEYFRKIVDKMKRATETARAEDPMETIKELGKSFTLTDNETKGVLERFIRDQDYTQYGAMNAVTNLANESPSYERATELEHIGGNILTMPQSQWAKMAQAA